MLKKFFSLLFVFYFLNTASFAVLSLKINHDEINYQNMIVDKNTGSLISGAKITIPDKNYTTYTNSDGSFKIDTNVSDKTVLFVEKEGYKTFSLTIDNSVLKSPLKIGIEEMSPFDIKISEGIVRLGDNMFSDNSANSSDFHNYAKSHFLSQKFSCPKYSKNGEVFLYIGSLIGLDTKRAKEEGQNKIARVYASPAEVFVNGYRIMSLELNGDNIEIPIPKSILKQENELVIKTGRNLFQTKYVDYDDIELANIRIEVKDNAAYARR